MRVTKDKAGKKHYFHLAYMFCLTFKFAGKKVLVVISASAIALYCSKEKNWYKKNLQSEDQQKEMLCSSGVNHVKSYVCQSKNDFLVVCIFGCWCVFQVG